MGATRAKRRNAHVKTTAKARVVSPSLSASSSSSSSSSSAAPADGPPSVDRFAPADPTAKNLHPYPPNRRPIFELFDPDELLAMVTCQRDVYTEKHGEMEHRRHVLRERNRGREWSYDDQLEYSYVKSYRGLLLEKKRFWELLCLEGTKPLPVAFKILNQRERDTLAKSIQNIPANFYLVPARIKTTAYQQTIDADDD